MADVPFLGCKINLISKSDIRYEGILYCVDAKESTIALSKVKSYGTENRADPNSSAWVAPKNDVYDIIIFRASDVKDLRVDAPEPPGLSDPAIISAHHSYPAQSISSTSSFNNTSNQASLSNNNPNSNAATSTLNSNGSLTNNISGPSNQHNSKQHQHQKPLLPFLPTGSSKEPHQQSSQLPTINYSSAAANAQRRVRPEKKSSDEHANGSGTAIKKSTHDMIRKDERGGRSDKRDDYRRDDRRHHRTDDRRDDKRDDRRGGSRDRRRGSSGNRMSRSGGYDRNHVNPRYNNNDRNNSRRGGPNRDKNSKNGGGGGGGGPPYRRGPMQGTRRARSGDRSGGPRGPRKTVPLKFEGEYDFDEANKEFLELENKLKNLKLKADENDGESIGDGLNSKSPAGNSESGSGYDSEDRNNKNGDSKDAFSDLVSGEFYDKTKSFFDNISCEASERGQGKVNKPDWRKERQTNAETFGISANYRRGGYRGRTYGNNGYHRR